MCFCTMNDAARLSEIATSSVRANDAGVEETPIHWQVSKSAELELEGDPTPDRLMSIKGSKYDSFIIAWAMPFSTMPSMMLSDREP